MVLDGTRRVVFGIGSNLGNRIETVHSAAESLCALPGVARWTLSPLYETRPVGGPAQGDYVNAALLMHSAQPAEALLGFALRIEADHGRVRAQKNGPRTLDLDILWIEGERIDEPGLTVPHARLLERAFALVPLLDVAPDALDPRTGHRLANHLQGLSLDGIREVQAGSDRQDGRIAAGAAGFVG
jgi:2-amino-4-hydroxy-6-hydroxymethyldihydropteridine diphosphokinase